MATIGRQGLVHLVRDGRGEFRKARRLARTCKPFLRQTQLFLRPNLTVDVDDHPIPLDDASVRITQGFGATVDPTVGAVGPPVPIFHRECLACGERVSEGTPDRRRVVGMNGALDGHLQTAGVWRIEILQGQAHILRESPVQVRWLPFGRGGPDLGRKGIDKPPQLLLALPKRLIGMHLIVDIVREAVPLDDAPLSFRIGSARPDIQR